MAARKRGTPSASSPRTAGAVRATTASTAAEPEGDAPCALTAAPRAAPAAGRAPAAASAGAPRPGDGPAAWGSGPSRTLSGGLQVLGRALAALGVALLLVGDLPPLAQRVHAGALDGGDVDEDVRAAVVGLDEAVALGGVGPLHRAGRHGVPPSLS